MKQELKNLMSILGEHDHCNAKYEVWVRLSWGVLECNCVNCGLEWREEGRTQLIYVPIQEAK
jgi:hypothetical protein